MQNNRSVYSNQVAIESSAHSQKVQRGMICVIYIDGSFHKNFEIHVNNNLNRDNLRSNKDKLPYFYGVITQ